MIKHVEIIVTSVEEAILAEKYGATRLELIDSFALGGLSPHSELIRDVCNAVNIPVNVMVRPHGRSFIFDEADMLCVIKEIEYIITKTKANAIVFGTLNELNQINFEQLDMVLSFIENSELGLTFHRAIDVSNNVEVNFKELINNYNDSKLERVLSSGGANKAVDGALSLVKMQEISKFSNIKLLVGSGVTPFNVSKIIKQVRCQEIHVGTGVRFNGNLDQKLFVQLLSNIN